MTKKKKKKKKKKFLRYFADSYLGNGSRDFVKNLKRGLPYMEANSTVKWVLFGQNITELRMHENHDFVVPDDILAPFAHVPFLGLHNILLCVLIKNSQTVKKKVQPMQKDSMKKVVKSRVTSQKWLWWSDNGKTFNNNNSGKFELPLPTGNQHQDPPELLLLKILPLSENHSHFWATTFDFTSFFMLPFLHGLYFFLQFGYF